MDREADFFGAAGVRRSENLQIAMIGVRRTRFPHSESTLSLTLAYFSAP